ncbi:hypothetical protein I7I53_11896 [Histoplasma capsulatum var. duboisii H88]|uniref:Uncharacterized protein n=1 Tax=Ajellomyces capsulatus (strain H88) TaxID=544711 RepID=A0A8A1LZ23_AJEC8|nr:hypothetical protein I7I53_11896 [Histoplasma capsulatum var. duboisii H88]
MQSKLRQDRAVCLAHKTAQDASMEATQTPSKGKSPARFCMKQVMEKNFEEGMKFLFDVWLVG